MAALDYWMVEWNLFNKLFLANYFPDTDVRSFTYVLLLIGSLLISLATWYIVARVHPIVAMPHELAMLDQPSAEQMAERTGYHQLNDGLVFAIVGAMTLLAGLPLLGLGGGSTKLIVAAIAAIVIGGLVGFLQSIIGHFCEAYLPYKWDVLVRISVRWMLMLLPLGIAASILLTICNGAYRQMFSIVLGGIVGALAAGSFYCLIAGVLLQTENSDAVLPPSSNSRLLLFFTVPFCLWMSIAYQFATAKASNKEISPEKMAAEPG